MKLTIDQEFKDLIPPLTADERQQLEENLIKEGCRDSLIVWNETLLDGHNRFEICQKHDIEFSTKELGLKDRNEAKEWIIRNQFGRRNLSPFQRAELALQLKPLVQARAKEKQREAGGDHGNQYSGGKLPVNQISDKSAKPKVDTYHEVAKIAGVSHDTVHKVDVILKEGSEEVKKAVASGEMSINRGYKETKGKEDKPIEQTTSPNVEEKKNPPRSRFRMLDEVDETGFPIVIPRGEPQEPITSISKFASIVQSFIYEINPLIFAEYIFQSITSKEDLIRFSEKILEAQDFLGTISGIVSNAIKNKEETQ